MTRLADLSDATKQLIGAIVAANPLQAQFIEESLSGLSAGEASLLDAYLSFCSDCGISCPYLAECYDTIVRDTVTEQLFFRRHGTYRYSKYAEVAQSVYQNPEYMKRYMYGLAITTYLWPNHRTIHRFFSTELPRRRGGRYLEIGPGHGVYFMTAMRDGAFEHYSGVDISPTSVELTRSLLASGRFGRFVNYELACSNFLDRNLPKTQYEAVVMGEVLEHVEDPEIFMTRIRELSTPDAFIFVTTAINAPAVDHIYLFDSVVAVHALVEGAGFRVVAEKTVPYSGMTLEESMTQRLPVNIALVLAPQS